MRSPLSLRLVGPLLVALLASVGRAAVADASAASGSSDERSVVVALNDASFDAAVQGKDVLVEFYAPWCGHCKKLAPLYDKVATKFEGKVVFAKVDATAEDCLQLSKRFEIGGFPTLKFFSKGMKPTEQPVEYGAERAEDELTNWVNKKVGPPARLLGKPSDIAGVLSSVWVHPKKPEPEPLACVVGLFRTEGEAVTFNKAAFDDDKFVYHVAYGPTAQEIARNYSTSVPSVVVFRSFADPVASTDSALLTNQTKIAAFAEANSEPPSNVVTLTDEAFEEAIKPGKLPIVVEFYAPWCGYCKDYVPKYDAVAKEYNVDKPGKVIIAKIDATAYDALANKERIESFPTVKMYKDGMSVPFKAAMERYHTSEWVSTRLGIEAKRITEAEVSAQFADPEVKVVAVARAPLASKKLVDRLAWSAPDDMSTHFVEVPAGTKPSVVLYRGGKEFSRYDGDLNDAEAFEVFRFRSLIPPAWRFNDDIFDAVIGGKLKAVVFLFSSLPPHAGDADIPDPKDEPKLEDQPLVMVETRVGASQRHPDVGFSFGETTQDGYLLEFFVVKPEETPTIRILDVTDSEVSHVYAPVTPFTAADLAREETYDKFIAAWRAGELRRIERPSAPAEEEGEEDEHAHEGHDHDGDYDEEGDDKDEL